MIHDMNRRDFMKASAAATGAVLMTGTAVPARAEELPSC